MRLEKAGNILMCFVIATALFILVLYATGVGVMQVFADESAEMQGTYEAEQNPKSVGQAEEGQLQQTDVPQKSPAGDEVLSQGNTQLQEDADYEDEKAYDLSNFVDLSPRYWARKNIEYVCCKGLMKGVYHDRFKPQGTFSRGMAVTVLYRMAGSPAVDTASAIELRSEPVYSSPAKNDKPDVDATVAGFVDVNPFWYYTEPIVWAQKEGIIYSGKTDKFAPESPISRAELASLLYYFARYSGYDVESASNGDVLKNFKDAASIADWSVRPLSYLVSTGILSGDDWGRINSSGKATRAEVAAILQRFVKNAPLYATPRASGDTDPGIDPEGTDPAAADSEADPGEDPAALNPAADPGTDLAATDGGDHKNSQNVTLL